MTFLGSIFSSNVRIQLVAFLRSDWVASFSVRRNLILGHYLMECILYSSCVAVVSLHGQEYFAAETSGWPGATPAFLTSQQLCSLSADLLH